LLDRVSGVLVALTVSECVVENCLYRISVDFLLRPYKTILNLPSVGMNTAPKNLCTNLLQHTGRLQTEASDSL